MEKWIDKKFDFDFPSDKYPEFMQKLNDTIPQLYFLVQSTRLDYLTKKDHDRWSIQEITGHLYTTDELFELRLDDYINRAGELTPADLSGKRTDSQNFNDMEIKMILRLFEQRRKKYLTRIESLEAEVFERKAIHPRLMTSMRLCDMLYFQSEHDQYHLNRINELIELYEAEE